MHVRGAAGFCGPQNDETRLAPGPAPRDAGAGSAFCDRPKPNLRSLCALRSEHSSAPTGKRNLLRLVFLMHRVSATCFALSDDSATAKDDPGDGELSKPEDQRGGPFKIVGQPASAAGWCSWMSSVSLEVSTPTVCAVVSVISRSRQRVDLSRTLDWLVRGRMSQTEWHRTDSV